LFVQNRLSLEANPDPEHFTKPASLSLSRPQFKLAFADRLGNEDGQSIYDFAPNVSNRLVVGAVEPIRDLEYRSQPAHLRPLFSLKRIIVFVLATRARVGSSSWE
jgi:hypothetical protein